MSGKLRDEKSPAISVLMPVYNAERYVAAAVESILAQTFGDFEFLIIDDGSSDRSLSILKQYAATDPRIRLTSRPNTGLVGALNEMLAAARGGFIARMDADDIAMCDRFAQQIEFLRNHPDVVCVGGFQNWIDEAGRVLFHYQDPTENDEIQQKLLTGCTAINHPSALIRRESLLQVGGYDEALWPAEDLDLWLRLGEIGKLANLDRVVLNYRQHRQSVSEQKQVQQTQKQQIACERAWQRRGITGQRVEIKPWRPVDARSRYETNLKYGWGFFNTGQREGAIAYGWRSIQVLPFAIDGWKLLICALVKPLPEVEG